MSYRHTIVDDGSLKTICGKCIHARPDVGSFKSNKEKQWEYAKCAATAKEIPNRINIISGEKIYSLDEMEFCSIKNHGDCELYEAKNIGNDTKQILDHLQKKVGDETWQDATDLHGQFTWDVVKAIENTVNKFLRFLRRFKIV